MKKIPARPSKLAGLTLLLLAFFIWGNFSFAWPQCSGIPSTVPWHTYTCEAESPDQDCSKWAQDCSSWLKCCIAKSTTTDANGCNLTTEEWNPQNDCCENKTAKAACTGTFLCTDCIIDDCMTLADNIKFQKLCTGAVGIRDSQKCECNSATGGTTDLPEDQNIMWMTIGPKCLLNGQCKFNIYDALGIRTSVRNENDPTSVGIFVQDVVLSATMFIGTIVTIAIIVSGLMRIFAGASGKDPTKAKSWLINALIGLLIVVSSYLIIRLVQYIVKGF